MNSYAIRKIICFWIIGLDYFCFVILISNILLMGYNKAIKKQESERLLCFNEDTLSMA